MKGAAWTLALCDMSEEISGTTARCGWSGLESEWSAKECCNGAGFPVDWRCAARQLIGLLQRSKSLLRHSVSGHARMLCMYRFKMTDNSNYEMLVSAERMVAALTSENTHLKDENLQLRREMMRIMSDKLAVAEECMQLQRAALADQQLREELRRQLQAAQDLVAHETTFRHQAEHHHRVSQEAMSYMLPIVSSAIQSLKETCVSAYQWEQAYRHLEHVHSRQATASDASATAAHLAQPESQNVNSSPFVLTLASEQQPSVAEELEAREPMELVCHIDLLAANCPDEMTNEVEVLVNGGEERGVEELEDRREELEDRREELEDRREELEGGVELANGLQQLEDGAQELEDGSEDPDRGSESDYESSEPEESTDSDSDSVSDATIREE